MGIRNTLILFFSAMAISMVILIVFFSLFFKNFDNLVTFDTKLPESAPAIQEVYGTSNPNAPSTELSKASGLLHATVNVPGDVKATPPPTAASTLPPENTFGANGGEEDLPLVGATPTQTSPTTEQTEAAGTKPAETTLPPGTSKTVDPAKEKEDSAKSSTTAKTTKAAEKASEKKAPVATTSPSEPLHNSSTKPTTATTTEDPAPAKPHEPVPPTREETTPPTPSAPVSPSASAPKGQLHQVYIDGFRSISEAESTVTALRAQGLNPILKHAGSSTPIVQLGTFSNMSYAQGLANRAHAKIKPLNITP